jgi:hypothetical protein
MRRVVILTCVGLFLVGPATPAWGAAHGRIGAQVVFSGGLRVPAGERANTVVVFHGPVRIDGAVEGSVVVFDGTLTVSGTIRDNAVVFNGHVLLKPGARVGGDLVTRQRPTIQSGATVVGQIKRLQNLSISLGLTWHWVIWIAYTASTLILGLILLALFPRALEAAAVAALARVGASIGWGLLLFFGLPIVGVLLLATVVGIPLGIALLLALWLVYTIGYTATLVVVGRSLVRLPRSRFVAFLAGWGIMRLLALIPFLGGVLWFAGAVYGLGALAAASSGTRRVAVGIPPPPPPVPAPPA